MSDEPAQLYDVSTLARAIASLNDVVAELVVGLASGQRPTRGWAAVVVKALAESLPRARGWTPERRRGLRRRMGGRAVISAGAMSDAARVTLNGDELSFLVGCCRIAIDESEEQLSGSIPYDRAGEERDWLERRGEMARQIAAKLERAGRRL